MMFQFFIFFFCLLNYTQLFSMQQSPTVSSAVAGRSLNQLQEELVQQPPPDATAALAPVLPPHNAAPPIDARLTQVINANLTQPNPNPKLIDLQTQASSISANNSANNSILRLCGVVFGVVLLTAFAGWSFARMKKSSQLKSI